MSADMATSGSRPSARPVALVTGAGRRLGIATAIALRLAETGWDVAFTHFAPYDARMEWGVDDGAADELTQRLRQAGARGFAMEADFEHVETPARVFDRVQEALGPVGALILGHCESVDSTILETSLESFDRHFAVNARAAWLLIREYARRFAGAHGTGRIIALTSDATVGNMPYGASKGALDRIVIAAAYELASLGVTANCVNPGPTDNGWMSDSLKAEIVQATPLGRSGTPVDAANLTAFLCSPEGGWINGQLLRSDGGFSRN
ncbi:MAG TPA: SDR family oxidoreductase [Actinocrinis sp.]|jgi:3-oxoacyl-[acyl-carrier protein] reductase